MNFLDSIKIKLKTKSELKRAEKERKRCSKKYPDWKNDEYNCGPLKFIWGVISHDDLSASEPNFYSMNDIDIYFNRDTENYILGIETVFLFENQEKRIQYLQKLLEQFKKYMEGKFDDSFDPHDLVLYNDGNMFEAKNLTELYYKFEIFVVGYSQL